MSNEIKLFVPKLMAIEHLNKIMKQAPHGALIVDSVYGSAANLFSVVMPQIYFSAMEKADGKHKNLYIDPRTRQSIINDIGGDLLSSNYDVMYSIAESLAEDDVKLSNISQYNVEYLNATQKHLDALMQKYNEWDSFMSTKNSTLEHCLDSMITIADEAIIHPLVERLKQRYTHMPYDINVDVIGPTILKVQF